MAIGSYRGVIYGYYRGENITIKETLGGVPTLVADYGLSGYPKPPVCYSHKSCDDYGNIRLPVIEPLEFKDLEPDMEVSVLPVRDTWGINKLKYRDMIGKNYIIKRILQYCEVIILEGETPWMKVWMVGPAPEPEVRSSYISLSTRDKLKRNRL